MNSICRIGDIVTGTCLVSTTGHPRSFTGTWTTGSQVVFADNIGVVRLGDSGITDCNHTFVAIAGSLYSTVEGLPLIRVGDTVEVIGGGTGTAITGSPMGDSF